MQLDFNIPARTPKMASPQLIFQGHWSQVVDNTSGRIENERQPVGLFTTVTDLLFRQNQNNYVSESNL